MSGWEIAGAILGAGASLMGAVSESQALDYEAEAARRNADIARMEAMSAIHKGQAESDKLSRQKRKLYGSQTAQLGASGLGYSGSPLEVMVESQAEYEKDLLYTSYNTDLAASGKRFEADIYDWNAKMAKSQKSNVWFSQIYKLPYSALIGYEAGSKIKGFGGSDA